MFGNVLKKDSTCVKVQVAPQPRSLSIIDGRPNNNNYVKLTGVLSTK